MSEVSFETFGDLAVSALTHTEMSARHAFQAGAEGRIVDDIVAKLQLKPSDAMLDIGCGTGNITVPLAAYVGSVTVVDHEKVIAALQKRGPVVTTYAGNFLSVRVPRHFDKILIYSVLHYLANEGEAWAFLRDALNLLRPGGMLLVGDIPNAERKRRFENSRFGMAFSKAWAARLPARSHASAKAGENGGNEFIDAINADKDRIVFDDGVIRRLMKELGLREKDYRVLPQPSTLPFGHTREDILITKPGPACAQPRFGEGR